MVTGNLGGGIVPTNIADYPVIWGLIHKPWTIRIHIKQPVFQWKSLYKPYIIGIYGLFHPQGSIFKQPVKRHGSRLRPLVITSSQELDLSENPRADRPKKMELYIWGPYKWPKIGWVFLGVKFHPT